MTPLPELPFPAARRVAYWLWLVCTLIIIMVGVGGITRLTESGLSIANWNPILGAIPPRNDAEWNAAFDLYKQRMSAQYDKFVAEEGEMTLARFQEIFFWEYIHRLLGRFIGLAYAVPLIWFLVRRQIPLRWVGPLLLGLLLGGGQGFLGWWMVKSGFSNLTSVSHLRLAAHLCMALLLFVYLLWLVLELLPYRTHRHTNYESLHPLRKHTLRFLGLLSLQIVYGAFTAGLRAGHMHPTYPLMGGRLFPAEGALWPLSAWVNSPATVQFIHRHLGLAVLVAAFALWIFAIRQRLMIRQKIAFNLLIVFATLQFILGIYTLISGVSIPIAVAHQVTACLLLGSAVAALHELIAPKTVTSRRS